MTTIAAGSSATLTLSVGDFVTVTSPPNSEGIVTVTRTGVSNAGSSTVTTPEQSHFGPPAISKTFGPYPLGGTIVIACTVGSIDYSTGGAISLGGVPTPVVLASGSGTYTPPTGWKYLKVWPRGAGGGGAGSGSGTSAGAGHDGGDTTFGPITAHGGKGATVSGSYFSGGGAGGAGTDGDLNIPGAAGGNVNPASTFSAGGLGGSTPYGANQPQINSQTVVNTPPAGSACGGNGASSDSGSTNGAGGGGAHSLEKVILPSAGASFNWAVGVGGAGGTAGTGAGANAGAKGADGGIYLEVFM